MNAFQVSLAPKLHLGTPLSPQFHCLPSSTPLGRNSAKATDGTRTGKNATGKTSANASRPLGDLVRHLSLRCNLWSSAVYESDGRREIYRILAGSRFLHYFFPLLAGFSLCTKVRRGSDHGRASGLDVRHGLHPLRRGIVVHLECENAACLPERDARIRRARCFEFDQLPRIDARGRYARRI